ncbi:MAG: hypothetical protein IPK60_04370 [Sandaracinaceae bacterium]|nr:hypothetical protein [Sandaracinaceae bacterium]
MNQQRLAIALALGGASTLVIVQACGGGSASERGGPSVQARGVTTDSNSATANNRCDATERGREVSEYDTSGDDHPDVRKVFQRMGTAPTVRLVLICREADLNGDGTKDVVRYYDDEGRPMREEADRDFDAAMDEISYYENGRIQRIETDTNHDGRVDLKVFYEAGQPLRTERDTAARSTADHWSPDRWEYFENGRMIRTGADVDGDGVVDRWDRDETLRRAAEQAEALEQAQADQAAAAENADAGVPTDAGRVDGGSRS